MVNRMHMKSIWRDKRGTSLVEILVVMVVLLVGIMTIVQMFPTGFRLVRVGESKSIASRLARQELERWKAHAANLPEAIVPVGEDITSNVVLNNDTPLSPFKGWYADAGSPSGFARGNALNIRRIIGEATDVPAPSYFGTGGGTQFGSRYTLAFSPIEVSRSRGDLVGLYIKGGDMKRNLHRGGQYLDLRAGNYAIDYNVASGQNYFMMWFPRDNATKRTYYVSYSYWKENGGNVSLVSVVNQPVVLNDGVWNSGWLDVPITGLGTGDTVIGLEESSDSCARGFVEQPNSFTNDPYEFKLADPIMGVVAFNPAGHGAYEQTALGRRPLKARIDYRMYDPRIMREDKVIPTSPVANDDIPVKMALRFILNLDQPTDNPNEETYQGLAMNPGSMYTLPLPVYVIDLSTGLQVELPGAYLQDTEAGGRLDYRSGVVNLPQRANLVDWQGDVQESMVELAGRHLRFFYRADGDWTVQCHKACSIYSRVYDAGAIAYNTFMLVGGNELRFAPCQAEQTVSVDFSYARTGGADTGEQRVSGFSGQIQMDPVGNWFLDIPVPAGCEVRRISVVGISFRSRVLWRDGVVWRNVDMDTTITRP